MQFVDHSSTRASNFPIVKEGKGHDHHILSEPFADLLGKLKSSFRRNYTEDDFIEAEKCTFLRIFFLSSHNIFTFISICIKAKAGKNNFVTRHKELCLFGNVVLGQIGDDVVQVVGIRVSVFPASQVGFMVNIVPGDAVIATGSDGLPHGEDKPLFVGALQQPQHLAAFVVVRQKSNAGKSLAKITAES